MSAGNRCTAADIDAWVEAQLADAPELDAATADRISRLLFGGGRRG